MLVTTLAAGAWVMALMALLPPPAGAAASVTVTTTLDNTPGSLRDALANATPGETIILPASPTPYQVSGGELSISRSLTISGAGAAATIIDGGNLTRVFHTSGAGSQITISGVTIKRGTARPTDQPSFANGGAILNEQATLTLSSDIITGNLAEADLAGPNLTGGTAEGGGVYNAGTLNLIDSNVNGNTVSANGADDHAGGHASGGGVLSTGAMTVRGSTIEGNVANAKGGSDVNGTPAELAGQIGGSASGGGLDLSQAGPTSISDSTLRDNVADGSAGPGAPASPSTLASGGGAYLQTDNTTGTITERNVTYAGNTARAVGGKAEGGGVTLVDTSTRQSLTNVTIFGNAATAGTTNQGGDLFVDAGASATIENTIVAAGGSDPGAENCGLLGTLTSLGHNIDSRDQCKFRATGDLTQADPLLASPANNGGPVQTIALKPGSPAIDAGAADVCPTTDARGALRPSGGGCDVGAFEVATPSATTTPASSVGTNAAVLNGSVRNPDLAPGTAFFQYGTTTGYGSSTPAQSVASATTQAQVGAPADGLTPGTTYHFRMVVRNAVGSAAGADQTFTTATVFHPARLVVRSVSVAGARATVTMTCEGTAGQRCVGTVRGTVRERVRGRSVVSVSADAAKRAPKTRTVAVASGSYSVSTGRVATVRITANAIGRRLLASFYRLPARFVFSGPPQVSRTIAFNYPRVRSQVVNNWFLKFPPCGACVTFATQLAIPQLPSGGAQVTVSCRGRGCPFARRVLRPRGRTVTFTNLLAHRPLAPGTRVGVLITAPNHVGEAVFYTMRPGTFPLLTTLCLPPGMRAPVACRPPG